MTKNNIADPQQSGSKMKILHIFTTGPSPTANQIIALQSRDHEVEVVDLSGVDIHYDELVDSIFSSDKVISW